MNDFVIHYYSTESKDFLAICLGNYSFTDRYCEKKNLANANTKNSTGARCLISLLHKTVKENG